MKSLIIAFFFILSISITLFAQAKTSDAENQENVISRKEFSAIVDDLKSADRVNAKKLDSLEKVLFEFGVQKDLYREAMFTQTTYFGGIVAIIFIVVFGYNYYKYKKHLNELKNVIAGYSKTFEIQSYNLYELSAKLNALLSVHFKNVKIPEYEILSLFNSIGDHCNAIKIASDVTKDTISENQIEMAIFSITANVKK